jgi:benzylsuccinate CoA-transferase BbsF subunit
MFMSAMGADVIRIGKVEPPHHTPELRRTGAGVPAPRTRGPGFASMITTSTGGASVDMQMNKRSILLDLKNPAAIDIVKRLARASDAVVDNFRAGVMDRLGLSYAELKAVKPDIVMMSISSGGANGPDREDRGYAAVFAALAGFSWLMGYEDGAPVELRNHSDMMCGTFAAVALMAALMRRQITGRGEYIDASNREMLASFVGDALVDYAVNLRSQTRQGNAHVAWTPHEIYKCRGDDRWVSIVARSDDEWQKLARVVGGEELARDRRFADGFLRWKHRDELDCVISAWTADKDEFQVMEMLQAAGVPSTPTLHPPDSLANPHIQSRDWWGLLDMGPDRTPHIRTGRVPWLLSKTPCEAYEPGSNPGADTDDVLTSVAGLSLDEIALLRDKRVLA